MPCVVRENHIIKANSLVYNAMHLCNSLFKQRSALHAMCGYQPSSAQIETHLLVRKAVQKCSVFISYSDLHWVTESHSALHVMCAQRDSPN